MCDVNFEYDNVHVKDDAQLISIILEYKCIYIYPYQAGVVFFQYRLNLQTRIIRIRLNMINISMRLFVCTKRSCLPIRILLFSSRYIANYTE